MDELVDFVFLEGGSGTNNVLFELGYDDGFRVILVGLWR